MMNIPHPPFSASRGSAILPICLVAGLMAGCAAFQPDVVACPDIAVAKGAEKVVMIGADLQHPVTMRFNGVSAECTPRRDGVAMKVDLGLMLKRAPENWNKTERVPFDVTLAFVDDKDEVVSRYVFSEEAFIADQSVKSRPTFVFRTHVPAGTRVVMGLGRAVSAEE